MLYYLSRTVSSALLESPVDTIVSVGSPASLWCRSTEGVEAVYSWYKDSHLVSGSPTRLLLPDGSLFFLTTSVSDTGLYSCSISDSQGVHSSLAATLTVMDMETQQEMETETEVIKEMVQEESLLSPPRVEQATILTPDTGLVQWATEERASPTW